MNTSKALKKILEVRGWTQAELARRAAWSTSHVSQLCSGRREAGRMAQEKLARVAGIPPLLFVLLGADEEDVKPGISPEVAAKLGDELLATLLEREQELAGIDGGSRS